MLNLLKVLNIEAADGIVDVAGRFSAMVGVTLELLEVLLKLQKSAGASECSG
jgi:hypothetical protein